MNFSSQLITWYTINSRDLPWRQTNDPYKIWLSEIILQQTKVQQGLPYFNNFICEFPTIFDLANSSEDKVLKLWQGLGYYSRARNLHYTAKYICFTCNGNFPQNYKDILNLKGVGEYTASAISSFAFNKNYAVLDGNVIRVLSRVFGIYTYFDTSSGKKQFKKLADFNLPLKDSYTYNQAIMEFGALVCTPKTPKCINCIFQDECYAFNNSKVQILPKKQNKIKVKNRYLNFLIVSIGDHVLLKKKNKGIWSGLYEFPSLEFKKDISKNNVVESSQWTNFFYRNNFQINNISPIIVHKLSHQKLHIRFFHIKSDKVKPNTYQLFKKDQLLQLPVSKAIENYLSQSFI